MTILALDTSTLKAVLVVLRDDGARFAASGDPATRHGRGLVPAIREQLHAAGLTLADLDGVVVGLGPGSFTGLRVGVMAAKTLAYATGKPLAGLDSLELVAHNAPGDVLSVAVAADAQRGDLFTAEFHREQPGGLLLRNGPNRLEPACALARPAARRYAAAGAGTGTAQRSRSVGAPARAHRVGRAATRGSGRAGARGLAQWTPR